jgi:glutamine synthetase
MQTKKRGVKNMLDDLLYVIPANSKKEDVKKALEEHPEIKFVSLVGVDMAGNDTDEKIPIRIFLKDMDDFYAGTAVQTDGSSVVLAGIATLNNAKVDMPVDPSVNWFVDYNFEHYDENSDRPVGTLRIPSFLIHEGKRVDSRAVLADTLSYVKNGMMKLFKEHPDISGLGVKGSDIADITFTSATELEFWVKTPLEEADIEEMSASQVMQEQYWERTHGAVRTALEECVMALDRYGLKAEMGHKEVGGIKAQVDEQGNMTHVCEQLEIDWRFADAVQACDNEIFVRSIVREIFRGNGLEVSFKAKPMIGLAGNGEHTHIGMAAVTKDGKPISLFAASEPKKDFMSVIGYGAIMGLLKNYEVINPFVSATNDSLNRLKPGFEAPICVVTSLGHKPEIPSRNRTVLAGLIRDLNTHLLHVLSFVLAILIPILILFLRPSILLFLMVLRLPLPRLRRNARLNFLRALARMGSIWKRIAPIVRKMMSSKTTQMRNAIISLVLLLLRFGRICSPLRRIRRRRVLLKPAAL